MVYFFLLHLYRYYYCQQYIFFRLFIYSFASIIRIITIVIISIHFFSFIYSFNFFPIECQATCFKNSSYIFSKSGGDWYENWYVCHYQGGNLVSIETVKEWQFISHEIQKRGNSNTSAWQIGLWEISGDWTWLSGEKLSISKWRDSQPDGSDSCAEISKNGGLFNGISCSDKNAFICEMPGGKITFQP